MRAVARIALLLVFVQIGLGGAVRLTDSGLSCPDWPLCHGLWIPTESALAEVPGLAHEPWQVMLEWAHRTNAAVAIAPAVLLLLAVAWQRGLRARTLAGLSLLLVVLQALLGRFTVLDFNSPESVAAHLGLALVLVVALVDLGTMRAPARRGRQHLFFDQPAKISGIRAASFGPHGTQSAPTLAMAGAVLAIATSVVGAYAAKTGAAALCQGWPVCEGWTAPDLSAPGMLSHMGHRLLALATSVAVLVLLVRMARYPATAVFMWTLASAVGVLLQVLLGALVVLDGIPFAVALLHQIVGALVVASLAGASLSGNRSW